ncbi:MAG: VCBS repeat-containing protein, partial [Bryobacterales bacterium]|nr:VCBS repeat-containing protein [Bryobacterales bacterium]
MQSASYLFVTLWSSFLGWLALRPLRAALLLLYAFAVVQPAAAIDCEDLATRIGAYSAIAQADSGVGLVFDPEDRAYFRFDPSLRRIRVLTPTPEAKECLQALLAFRDFAASAPNRAGAVAPLSLTLPANSVFGAQEFAIGDLNGDGVSDGVGLSTGSALYVFRGNNTNQMASAGSFAVGGTPGRVLLADLNGDGRLDAIVTRTGIAGGLSVLLGNGDLTFQDATLSPAGSNPRSLAAGDFNADGKLDIAVAFGGDGSANSAGIAIVMGNGDGSFQSPTILASPLGVSSVLAADLNGDGKLDLALGNNLTDTVTVFPGTGLGTFGAGVSTPIGAGPGFLAAMDLNQDGKADLVAQLNDLNGLSFLLGNGDGSFQLVTTLAAGANARSFVALDLLEDGTRTVFFVPGPGSDLTIVGIAADGRVAGQQMIFAPPQLRDITTGDFNNDGNADVAAAGAGNSASDVAVLLSQPNGQLAKGPTFRIGSAPVAVVSGDFDGDGNTDLAVTPGNQPGAIKLLRGDGSGNFQDPVSTSVIGAPLHAAGADFNRDGRSDLAISVRASSGPGSVAIFLGSPSGSFSQSGTLTAGNRPVFAAAGHLNGDGFIDLAIVDEGLLGSQVDPGGLYVFLGKGDGTFQEGVRYDAGLNPSSVAIGDINHDGLLDLAITTTTPDFGFRAGVLLASGDGAFSPPIFTTVAFGPRHIAVDDFNQDGKNDLLVTHCCGNLGPAVLFGNGDGTFGDEEFFAAPGDTSR